MESHLLGIGQDRPRRNRNTPTTSTHKVGDDDEEILCAYEDAKLEHIVRDLPFTLGNILKYVWRAPYKGGAEDCIKALDYLLIFQKAPRKYNLTKNAQAAIHNILITFPNGESEETEDIHRCAVRQTLAFINNSEDKVDNEELGEAKDKIIRLLIGMHDVESSR